MNHLAHATEQLMTAAERVRNEIKWLNEESKDLILDAVELLFDSEVSVNAALDLHKIVDTSDDLNQDEKTILHMAINLKIGEDE